MKLEILNAIWGRSHHRTALPYIAMIDRRTAKFSERPYNAAEYLIQHDQMDMFFSPLLFDGPRKNDNAVLPGVMYADMDDTSTWPTAVPEASVIWETSRGCMQAVWFLAEAPPDAVRWAALNRALTYAAHADKGGWHASKLLRVPETRNYKYPDAPLGKVLSFTKEEFSFTDLEKAFVEPEDTHAVGDFGAHPNLPNDQEWKDLCRIAWPALTLEQRSLLAAPRVMDRSSQIVRFSNSLTGSGFAYPTTFCLIWGTAWNKWRVSRHNPAYLWKIVNT